MSDFSVGTKAAEVIKSKFAGKLDGLIVNHGILEPVKRVADVEADEWRRSFDVNVFSAVAMVRISTTTSTAVSFMPPLDTLRNTHRVERCMILADATFLDQSLSSPFA